MMVSQRKFKADLVTYCDLTPLLPHCIAFPLTSQQPTCFSLIVPKYNFIKLKI